jgi:hypothetical protein
MHFTDHALMRIEEGDEHGLRTLLSVEEIKKILESKLPVACRSGYVFWSTTDRKCLVAATSDDLKDPQCRIRSIVPANRIPFVLCLLAERKARGDKALIMGLPPQPESLAKSDSALISLVYYEELALGHRRCLREIPLVNWFDYRTALFRYREFLTYLVAETDRRANRSFLRSLSHSVVIEFRGIGFRYEIPWTIPLDLLGIT